MTKKLFILLMYALLVTVAFTKKEILLEMVRAGGYISVVASIFFLALLVFFPAVPFVVAAGVIAAVYGAWIGAIIVVIGSMAGTLVMFLMVRYGFQDWMTHYLNKYPNVQLYKALVQRNSFLGIIFISAIPVIPSPVINVLCGITNIPTRIFFSASLIGKLPAIFIFCFAGSQFLNNTIQSFTIYVVYGSLVGILAIYLTKRVINTPVKQFTNEIGKEEEGILNERAEGKIN